MTRQEEQDLRLEKICRVVPCVPFKGIDRFYDIGGLLKDPFAFQLAIDILLERYSSKQDTFTAIGAFDARGFLIAPILGLALKKKVFMLRKPGKMPTVAASVEYRKEYSGDLQTGKDEISIQENVLERGERVLLVDDLMATGGTVEAGIKLIHTVGAHVVEASFLIEISPLGARSRLNTLYPNITLWSMLTNESFDNK